MNYRHAFHAGSFSDVLKHAVLARILVHLKRKEAPFRFIDTHAGAGRYDLSGDQARRSPEWREGIARVLMARPPAPVGELLRPYLQAVGPHDAEGRPVAYPGSPAIAQALFATAIGLAAAIPAYVAYNKFSTDAGKFSARLEGFADDLVTAIQRRLAERSA